MTPSLVDLDPQDCQDLLVLEEMPLLVPQAPRDPLVSQAEATMGSQDFQDHLVHLDLLEDHTLESPGTHVLSVFQDHQDLLEHRVNLDIPQE